MKSWYAIYTRPRSEKRVKEELQEMGFECYVPIRKVLRQWSDRKKWVELPVISGYAFVKSGQHDKSKILSVYGAVQFVMFEGKAVPITDDQIKNLKIMLQEAETINIDCGSYTPGEKVEILAGPMKGFIGEVIHDQKRYKILLRLEQLGMNITAEVNKNTLKKVAQISQPK